jgi:hypothetical protein
VLCGISDFRPNIAKVITKDDAFKQTRKILFKHSSMPDSIHHVCSDVINAAQKREIPHKPDAVGPNIPACRRKPKIFDQTFSFAVQKGQKIDKQPGLPALR